MNAELSPELTALVGAARGLTPEQVRQVTHYAEELGKQHAAPPVDESTEWSEEDMRDLAAASIREFEARHPDEDWAEAQNPEKRGVIRAAILADPDASDHGIARRVRMSRGLVKSVRLEMMDRDEIPGKPWGRYAPYGSASGGNHWLSDGSMINQDEFNRRRARGLYPEYRPPEVV